MSNWLESYTKDCCNELGNVATLLQNMENAFITANDDYYQYAQKASDPTVYQGRGATAFIEAVNSDINKSKYKIEGLGHAASATTTLQSAITSTSQYYDGKLVNITSDAPSYPYMASLVFTGVPQDTFDRWRDQLITKTLDGVGTHQQLLDDILRNGDQCILRAWNAAFKAVESTVRQDADNSSPLLTPIINLAKDVLAPAQDALEEPYLAVFHGLASSIKSFLQEWANAIEHEYPTFQNALSNFDYLSARDLFYYIGNNTDETQNKDKPITITPYTTKDGRTGLLITIAGTDTTHSWDTSLLTALGTGMGMDSPYLADVENAIKTYMQEHPEMANVNNGAGPDVTLDGYSLGGMTAQLVADDTSFLANNHLHVTNVVTYGAPVMGPPARGVKYAMYDATYDPIPLLSHYENPQLDQSNAYVAAGLAATGGLPVSVGDLAATYFSIEHAQEEPWQQKLDTYIDPKHEYPGQIFNITDVGNQPAQWGPFQYPNFDAHTHYTVSNQLNSRGTIGQLPNIDPTSLGPTEYFGMSDPGPSPTPGTVPTGGPAHQQPSVGHGAHHQPVPTQSPTPQPVPTPVSQPTP